MFKSALPAFCLALLLALPAFAEPPEEKKDPFQASLAGLSKLGVRVKVGVEDLQGGEITEKAILDEAQDDIRHSDVEGRLRDEGFSLAIPAELDKNPLLPQLVVDGSLRRGDLFANGALDKTCGIVEVTVFLLQPVSLVRNPRVKTLSITWIGRRTNFVKGLAPAKPDASAIRLAVRSIMADFVKAWKNQNGK